MALSRRRRRSGRTLAQDVSPLTPVADDAGPVVAAFTTGGLPVRARVLTPQVTLGAAPAPPPTATRVATAIALAPSTSYAATVGDAPFTVTATVLDQSGAAIADATGTWGSGNPAVAALTQAGRTATVTPASAGQAVLEYRVPRAGLADLVRTVQVGVAAPAGVTPPPPSASVDDWRYRARYTLPRRYDASGSYTNTQGVVQFVAYDPVTKLHGDNFDAPYPTDANSYAEVLCATGAELQAAINAAGDAARRLRLTPGVDYGEIRVPARSRTAGWLLIEPQSIKAGTFPKVEGQDVTPDDAEAMPKFYLSNNGQVIACDRGASRVRIVGCEIALAPGYDPGPWNNALRVSYGLVKTSYGDGTDASYTYWFGLDRCYLHGTLGKSLVRTADLNGRFIFALNCDMRDVGTTQTDAQCIHVGDGAGPYLIKGGRLECSLGEHIMFGGSRIEGPTTCPADIVVRNVKFYDATSWRALGAGTKEFLEFKCGVRALVEGNLYVGYNQNPPYGGQSKLCMHKTTNDQGAGQPAWGRTQDITHRANKLLNCTGGYGIEGGSNLAGAETPEATARIEIAHNLGINSDTGVSVSYYHYFDQGRTPAQVNANEQLLVRDIAVHHNTWIGMPAAPDAKPVAWWDGSDIDNATTTRLKRPRWQIEENIVAFADGLEPGWSMTNYYFPSQASLRWGPFAGTDIAGLLADNPGSAWRNAFAGAFNPDWAYAGDLLYANRAALGLTADYRPTGALLTAGRGSQPFGCDIDLLNRALAGVA